MAVSEIPDGEMELIPVFMSPIEADSLLAGLLDELVWREEHLVMFGRSVLAPRLVCWYGDPGAGYRYSGVSHVPEPWTPTLLDLRGRIERRSGQSFNSVLGNLYRTGADSMGWHADKEKELGPKPFIASLSLGAERRFELRHNQSGECLRLALTHGSLLLMGGAMQHHWRHRVPKQRGLTEPRINLTFRLIFP